MDQNFAGDSHGRLAGELAGLSTLGAFASLVAVVNQQAALGWIGFSAAVGAAGISWWIAQRSKIRHQERLDRWEDALVQWRIERMKAGEGGVPCDQCPYRVDAQPAKARES